MISNVTKARAGEILAAIKADAPIPPPAGGWSEVELVIVAAACQAFIYDKAEAYYDDEDERTEEKDKFNMEEFVETTIPKEIFAHVAAFIELLGNPAKDAAARRIEGIQRRIRRDYYERLAAEHSEAVPK